MTDTDIDEEMLNFAIVVQVMHLEPGLLALVLTASAITEGWWDRK
jgi:hypothetical protein